MSLAAERFVATALMLAVVAAVVALAWWRRRPRSHVYPPQIGLLYRDGRFVRRIEGGTYVHRTDGSRVVLVTTAEQLVTLPDMTVLSRDQFAFRLSLAAAVIVTDPRVFAESQGIGGSYGGATHDAGTGQPLLQPLAAAAAQALAAERTLTNLLADRAGLVAALEGRLADALPGATVGRVLLTGVSLPPETRRMFTDAERARREAEAALERARGEQASLRALANAARLLRDHPGLADLRLFQAIEGRKGPTTLVLGCDPTSPNPPPPGGGGTRRVTEGEDR